ncbi:MAG: tetratricopeptide repeat protein [Paludibacteraceae bacterium]|nr:tetratricopeptide repeat protein [Paludibacteraceae bacterium]
MSKKEEKKHDELENVEHALSTSEAFIEKYQKQLLMAVGAVVLVVLAVLAVKNFYLEPLETEAQNEMAKAQSVFATDSFNLALNGNNNDIIGFKEIASEYGLTASGNLATAYAGICYYKLGQYDNAIKSLSQFDGDDSYFNTSVIGLIGDSHVELGQTEKGIGYFEKAAAAKNNVLSPIYLKKAGIAYESLQKNDKALSFYTQIKDDYPRSQEAADIEKYIARVQK